MTAKPKDPPKKQGRRYPWDEWFRPRSTHTLVAGRDYPSDVAEVWMMQSIWRMARLRGVRISLTTSVTEGTRPVLVLKVTGTRPKAVDRRAQRRAQARAEKSPVRGKKVKT